MSWGQELAAWDRNAKSVAETTTEVTPRLRMIAGICVTAAYIDTMRRERDALLSLAKTQRRLSWRYRRLALDYQAEGNLDGYRRTGAEARRLWRDAKAHLQAAKARNF